MVRGQVSQPVSKKNRNRLAQFKPFKCWSRIIRNLGFVTTAFADVSAPSGARSSVGAMLTKKLNATSFNSLRQSDACMRHKHHWFKQWLVAWTAPSHYLNQCWNIVNWTWGTNVHEILINIHTFSSKKMHLKASSAIRRPFCFALNMLKSLTTRFCEISWLLQCRERPAFTMGLTSIHRNELDSFSTSRISVYAQHRTSDECVCLQMVGPVGKFASEKWSVGPMMGL